MEEQEGEARRDDDHDKLEDMMEKKKDPCAKCNEFKEIRKAKSFNVFMEIQKKKMYLMERWSSKCARSKMSCT